jgi:hypothetical protein
MFTSAHCDADQQRLLDSAPHFLLSPEEQVNFHFMMHSRHKLKSPDFMASYESALHEKKLQDILEHCPELTTMDSAKTFIKLEKYDLSNVSPAEFQAMLNNPKTPPIVASGLIKDTVAVRTWSHDFLLKNYGDVEIVAWEYGTATSPSNVQFEQMKVRDILRSQLDDSAERSYYINNSAEIFAYYPHLADEMGADRILDLFKGHSINSFNQLFVGSLKTWGTDWHLGNAISCAIMITGVKRWFFMDPRMTYVLKPFFNGSNGMGTQTEIRKELKDHFLLNPLYAYAPKFYIDIEPGDVVFFNKFWPHAVINLSPLQIMSNMRMTEVDLENMKLGHSARTLLPVYDNILNSDPEFIKFKFDIFKNLGTKNKTIADSNYFAAYWKSFRQSSTITDDLEKENAAK